MMVVGRRTRPWLRPSTLLVGALSIVVLLGLVLSTLPATGGTDRAGSGAIGSTAAIPPAAPSSERSSVAAPTSHPESTPSILAVPNWINLTGDQAGGSLPALYAESVAFDPVANVTVLFGGCLNIVCPSNQTWLFSNGTWSNVTNPTGSPPPREYASMDFDANMGGVLLFGGLGINGPLNDTWLYQGGIWTNLTYVGGAPSPRFAAAMAFDPDPEENGSVLYGGCIIDIIVYECSNDTWVWQSWSGWTPLTPSEIPPPLGFAGMAYDPVIEALVLFGGCEGGFCFSENDATWELYSGQWWDVAPTTSPAGRQDFSMGYDPVGQQILLFGGFNASESDLNDTWSFTSGGWTMLSPVTSASPREDYGLSWDPTGETVLLVGGNTAYGLANDTWAYEIPPSVTVSASHTSAETSQTVNFTVALSDGTPRYGVEISFGDGTIAWGAGNGPDVDFSHAFAYVGTYTARVNATDSLGVPASSSASAVVVAAGPAITAGASPSAGDLGLPFAFTTFIASAGSGSLMFAWSFGDGTDGVGLNSTHAYGTAGIYHASVTTTDSVGGTAQASLTVTVVADPTVALSITPTQPNTTSLVTFATTVSGGTGPFAYSWEFGDGSSSVLPSPVHEYARTGVFSVTVWVNDSVGGSAKSLTTVTVVSPSGGGSSASSSNGVPLWFWAGIAVLVVVGAVGTVFLLRRRPST